MILSYIIFICKCKNIYYPSWNYNQSPQWVFVPEDVLCVQIYVQPIDEQGRVSWLQAQCSFEKLQKEMSKVTKWSVDIKRQNSSLNTS